MGRRICFLLLAIAVYGGSAHDEHEDVTCGSVLKLENVESSRLLHSHDISWGSGSRQQSVTAFEAHDDPNSLWMVKESHSAPMCERGAHRGGLASKPAPSHPRAAPPRRPDALRHRCPPGARYHGAQPAQPRLSVAHVAPAGGQRVRWGRPRGHGRRLAAAVRYGRVEAPATRPAAARRDGALPFDALGARLQRPQLPQLVRGFPRVPPAPRRRTAGMLRLGLPGPRLWGDRAPLTARCRLTCLVPPRSPIVGQLEVAASAPRGSSEEWVADLGIYF